MNQAAQEGIQGCKRERRSNRTRRVCTMRRNPVVDDDPESCGEPGSPPDGRLALLHITLGRSFHPISFGYGPSAVDPLTGEIIAVKPMCMGLPSTNGQAHAVDDSLLRW